MIQLTEATPVDEYVYELKTKHGSKFYQNIEDAFDAKQKIFKETRELDIKIIRHNLMFTSEEASEHERINIELDNQMRDLNFFVDEVYKPKKHWTFSWSNMVNFIFGITIGCEFIFLIYRLLL